jgi:hypothetical protein
VVVDFLLLLVVAVTYMTRSSGGGPTRIGDCSWLAPVIVRGLVPSPMESRKVTLVDCSCH